MSDATTAPDVEIPDPYAIPLASIDVAQAALFQRNLQGRYFERLLRRLGYVTTLKVVNAGFDYFGAAADPRNHAQIGMHGWLADYPTPATFFDPNVVKVVLDAQGFAQYFSRAPVPYARDAFARSREALPQGLPALRHIGIYAYRVRFLREYASLTPTPAERFEALEQLRALGHGHRIAVALWHEPMEAGVDTQEDLERVRARLTRPL